MTIKRFIRAAAVVGFAALSLSPVKAQAQLGGLVNRAKRAVHPDEAVKPANRRDGLLTVTSARIDAYIKGSRAEHLEGQRLDSMEVLSQSTPQGARMSAVMKCQIEASAKNNQETPEQQRSDSLLASRPFAGMDTAKMKKLALAAQAGDAAAMTELRAMGTEMSKRTAADPKMIELRERLMKSSEATAKASAACEKRTPPEASFAAPIARAKTEIAKYGTRLSQARNAHLESVKLQAANGMSSAEYAGVEERVRAYMGNPDSPHGFSPDELALLRARRAQLGMLNP
ncbi:MAG: hypothetical protein ABI026_10830 [Gemmatimonadaceae bacterium]